MKKRAAAYAPLLPALGLLALLLILQKEAAEGARAGLSVCAGVVLPSLFPFLVLSSLLSAHGLPAALASLTGPLLRRLGLSPACASPFLLGLCSGYPLGAGAVAELVRGGTLSPEEGARLLPCCNNTGPGFIIGVAGSAVFGSARTGAVLYLCHVLASLTLLLIFGRGIRAQPARSSAARRAAGSSAFPAAVGAAAETALHLSAYIVFFSMLTALFRAVGLFSSLAAAISGAFGTELRFSYALLSGLLELGSGVSALRGMPASPANLALAAFLLGFGGVSVHAQTRHAVSGTEIRCARHFAGRIFHGLLSAAYLLLLTAAVRLPQV